MIDREKVARAIAGEVAGVEPGRVRFSWDSVVAFDGGPALDCAALADAAIASVLEQLREPSEAMIEAGWHAWHESPVEQELRDDCRALWQAMLGAFLQAESSSNPAE